MSDKPPNGVRGHSNTHPAGEGWTEGYDKNPGQEKEAEGQEKELAFCSTTTQCHERIGGAPGSFHHHPQIYGLPHL